MGYYQAELMRQFAPKTKSDQYLSGLRKNFYYTDKETGEEKRLPLQNKEDLFVKEALDAIDMQDQEKLIKLFNSVE